MINLDAVNRAPLDLWELSQTLRNTPRDQVDPAGGGAVELHQHRAFESGEDGRGIRLLRHRAHRDLAFRRHQVNGVAGAERDPEIGFEGDRFRDTRSNRKIQSELRLSTRF